MSIAHSFMRIHIHRDCFISIARYEHSSYFGPMYEHSSYYDSGFIIDELMCIRLSEKEKVCGVGF